MFESDIQVRRATCEKRCSTSLRKQEARSEHPGTQEGGAISTQHHPISTLRPVPRSNAAIPTVHDSYNGSTHPSPHQTKQKLHVPLHDGCAHTPTHLPCLALSTIKVCPSATCPALDRRDGLSHMAHGRSKRTCVYNFAVPARDLPMDRTMTKESADSRHLYIVASSVVGSWTDSRESNIGERCSGHFAAQSCQNSDSPVRALSYV